MTCPFIDSDNPHCSSSLNMSHLDNAFELCNDHYNLCPLYLQLARDHTPPPVSASATVVSGTGLDR